MKFSRKEMGTGSGVSSAGGGSGVRQGRATRRAWAPPTTTTTGARAGRRRRRRRLRRRPVRFDLLVADSDDEDGGGDGGDGDGISDPRQLLAATKALDAEAAAGGPGAPLAALPNLDLTTVGGSYDDDNPPFPGCSRRARATPSMLSRLKNKSLG